MVAAEYLKSLDYVFHMSCLDLWETQPGPNKVQPSRNHLDTLLDWGLLPGTFLHRSRELH